MQLGWLIEKMPLNKSGHRYDVLSTSDLLDKDDSQRVSKWKKFIDHIHIFLKRVVWEMKVFAEDVSFSDIHVVVFGQI